MGKSRMVIPFVPFTFAHKDEQHLKMIHALSLSSYGFFPFGNRFESEEKKCENVTTEIQTAECD